VPNSLKGFDEFITKELFLESHKIKDKAIDRFELLLVWVTLGIEEGKSPRRIKKYISGYDTDKDLEKNLAEFIGQQYSILTGAKKTVDLDKYENAGFTFLEEAKERKSAIKRRAIRFMAKAIEIHKEGLSLSRFRSEEVARYSKATENFWRNTAKAGREYAYADIDKENGKRIRGWMSIAILDGKTSAQCIGKHNQFYSRKDYASRFDIPDPPPRHPHCRSILITVWEGVNITLFKGQKLETFFRRNPETAEMMMGKEKYRLWSGGKAKVRSYIDIKGSRWFRNDEIIKRLGIIAEKRLIAG